MSWLKPIFEKLQVNAFIAAICITSFICWLSIKNFLFLALSICCAIYLFILFIIFCVNNYNYNIEIDRRNKEKEEEAHKEHDKFNLQLNIWFATLPQFTKENLIKLLEWESLPSFPYIKMMRPSDKYLFFNTYEFKLEQDFGKEPIVLLGHYQNPTPYSRPAYVIHPELFEILKKI